MTENKKTTGKKAIYNEILSIIIVVDMVAVAAAVAAMVVVVIVAVLMMTMTGWSGHKFKNKIRIKS